jgi:hypothetical protein
MKQTKGMPKHSKMLDYKELWKGKKSAMNEYSNYDQASSYGAKSKYSDASGYTGPSSVTKGGGYYANAVKEIKIDTSAAKGKGGKKFIPKEFEFPSTLLEPLKFGEADEPRKYFKIVAKGEEYILLIDPLVKTSFDEIERGRTSFGKEKKLFELTKFIKEKVPQQIRGLMKKYAQGVKASVGGFIPLPLVLTKREDKYFIKNPATTSDNIKSDIGTSLYETLQNIVQEELLNEVTYSKFKNEVKFRTKNEQLHKAIREVKRKLTEIDRIVEYTQRMKQELSEGEEGIKYWKNTEKNIAAISEMVNHLNNKIKNLHQ